MADNDEGNDGRRAPRACTLSYDRRMMALQRAGSAALILAPGGLTAYMSLQDGGFFPGTQAFAAVLVLVALAARITFAEQPFAGLNGFVLAAAGVLALYSLWTLASGLWSDAPARALLEFNRSLLYLATVLLFGSVPRDDQRVERMVWALVVAFAVVAGIALLTRLFPASFPTAPNLQNERLSYPLTYWNALGLLAALGLILSLGLACRARGPLLARVLAAAVVPMLACTALFTFSRGAIVAGAIGVVAYFLVGGPRGLVSGLLAVGPFTFVAVKVAYGADALATATPTSRAAVEQGGHVARVLLLCMIGASLARLALILLDQRLARIRISNLTRRRVLRPLAGAAATIVLLAAVLAGAPGFVSRQYDRFARGDQTEFRGDFRERLSDPASPARQRQWEVATDDFHSARLVGHGADTYQLAWERHRPNPSTVVDAHSLYIEVLGELGVVGFVLIVSTIFALLVGLVLRARGRNRPLYAALTAAGLAWTSHAGVDWDWEMPAVTLWLFALGGTALARRQDHEPRMQRAPHPYARLASGLLVLMVMIVPVLVAVSQRHLGSARAAFALEDCRTAASEARAAISTLAVLPEPYEILAYCEIRSGDPREAVEQMEKAVTRDPGNWNYRYSLAVARGAAGLDPRPAARASARLNPLEPLTQDLVKRFSTSRRTLWVRRARDLAQSFLAL